MNRWLRFCDKTPIEHYEAQKDPATNIPDGWVTFVLAVRSDGFLYQSNFLTEREPKDEELATIRRAGRDFLNTMLDETPPGISPSHDPANFMKGIVYANGDQWIESEPVECSVSA